MYTVKNKGTLEVTNGYSLCPYFSTLMGTLEIAFVESSVHYKKKSRTALNGI